jgi:fructose-1-phosphate kinase PfkB-like protein
MTGALRVAPADYAELLRRFRARLAAGVTWVVAGGSLPAGAPPDFYRTLAAEAGQAAVPFLLDSVGAPALAALCGRPTILKLNRAEFAATFANAVATVADLRRAAQAVLSQHALPALVLTLGREGILAITPDHAYLVAAPVQQEVNAAGSGDAVSAALAWRFLLGDDWRAALRWAAAAGAATVLTEGTAECRMADVLRILPETTIQELP